MDIAKSISEIGKALKEDSGEGTKNLLAQIESEFTTMQDTLARVNNESKKRREKINELTIANEELISTKDLEIGKLNKKINALSDDNAIEKLQAEHTVKINELTTEHESKVSDLTTRNEQLLESQKQLHEVFRNEVVNDLTNLKDHPNFEKVKDKLKLPEIKEDKYDFENYSDEDMLFTKSKLSEYKGIGYFEIDGKKPDNPQTPIVTKTGEIDIEELARTDPAAARKELDRRKRFKRTLV